jgi:hypothetical protein
MAETEKSGSGGSNLTRVLSVVAVLLLGGFLVWLAVTAKPSQGPKVAESSADSTNANASAAIETVPLTTFAADIEVYRDKTIRLENLKVASLLGGRAFWIQLPTQVPFLVKLDSTATVLGTLAQGADVTVTGSVHVMSDSVLSAWLQEGAITQGQKAEASFAQSFLEAQRVLISATQAAPAAGSKPGA